MILNILGDNRYKSAFTAGAGTYAEFSRNPRDHEH